MNIKDIKFDEKEFDKFVKDGGLIKAAKVESEILQKAWEKEEKEKNAKDNKK